MGQTYNAHGRNAYNIFVGRPEGKDFSEE